MARIDLSQPTRHLIWPVIRANLQPLLPALVMVSGAYLLAEYGRTQAAGMHPIAIGFAAFVVDALVWVLVETSIAFAVYPTLLTGGLLSGYAALRKAAFPRLALYAAAQVGFGLALLLASVPVIWIVMLSQTQLTPDMFQIWPTMLLIAATVVITALFGLILPDIVMRGRLSLGMALGGLRHEARRMIPGLVLGAGPLWAASHQLYVAAEAGAGTVTLDGANLVGPLALVVAATALSMLGTVVASITLAKAYRACMPPDTIPQDGRVAEIFD